MRVVPSLLVGCMVASAASVAFAAPLDAVLMPAAPLAADGERAHLLRLYVLAGDALAAGLPTVRAARGAIVAAPVPTSDGGVALRYRPPRVTAPATDTLTVSWHGHARTLAIALEPAGRGKLTIDVPPAPLVAGHATPTALKLHVRDASGRPARAALRIAASVGRVGALRETATGEYVFSYTPPDDKYPQVAIVAALSIADGAFAAAPIRLAARVTVTGEGEPGATMTLAVDGHEFPSTVIGADGRFNVPLVVPPGGRATGLSVDKLGNQQRREIDLALPPFPRLLLGAVPPTLPADGAAHAEIVAFAVDARGNPERRAPPPLSASAGTLSPPIPRGDGSTTWTLTAPSTIGAGAVTLRAAGAATTVALRPGPPRAIEVLAPREPLPAGLDAAVTVEARVRDAEGSPVDGATLTAAMAGGRVLGTSALGARGHGAYAIELVPPRDAGRGSALLHVEVAAVAPGAPRRVTLHPAPRAKLTSGELVAEAWIDDDVGLPVPGAMVELVAPGKSAAVVAADRYGTARVAFALPAARSFRVTAQPAELPGVAAALDYLVVGGVVHAVGSIAGGGVVEAGEPP
ncbi:MAG TPA: Ig-like domain-containing protein, partial [Polyangia bacterium]